MSKASKVESSCRSILIEDVEEELKLVDIDDDNLKYIDNDTHRLCRNYTPFKTKIGSRKKIHILNYNCVNHELEVD